MTRHNAAATHPGPLLVVRDYGGLFVVLGLLIWARTGAVTTPGAWIGLAVTCVLVLFAWQTVAQLRDWGQLPRGWHLYDRTCVCAACETEAPRSPYCKAR